MDRVTLEADSNRISSVMQHSANARQQESGTESSSNRSASATKRPSSEGWGDVVENSVARPGCPS